MRLRPYLMLTALVFGFLPAACAGKGKDSASLESLAKDVQAVREEAAARDTEWQRAQSVSDERLNQLEMRLTAVERKTGLDSGELDKAVSRVATSPEERPWAVTPKPRQEGAAPAKAPAGTKNIVQAVKAKPAKAGDSPKALYDRGLALVLAGKSGPARAVFQDFLSRYGGNALEPNALYWLGESHYAEKDYGQAILVFKDVSRKFPRSEKAPAALLKMGMAYQEMGDANNAAFYLRVLLDEYPDSEPAPKARQRLKSLSAG